MNSVGTVLKERYEIIAELGEGGMSKVYLARDKNLGSYWAVKQVKNNGSAGVVAFKKEVELLSTLNYPDVPRIVDRIEIGEDFFVCMDFIDGVPLGRKLASEGAQSEKDVIVWGKFLCDVLNYLHTVRENPIVYRDMKPDNIMLAKTGRVKLIDFGVAKECARGQAIIGEKYGTKGYAAPEQYKGNPLDERTDIYSLGVTLHHLVTATNPPIPLSGKLQESPSPIRQINPMLSEGLEYIINKCTEIDPVNRYQNCMELKYDLENIETLNSKYRKDMQKKLGRFSISVACFMLSMIFMLIGMSGISKAKAENYQQAFAMAMSYEQAQDYEGAEGAYIEAIAYNPNAIDPYIRLFNVLLPKNNDPNYIARTKYAIDSMKKYVDNKYSPMYNNPQLLYQLIKPCLNVNDPVYAGYAYTYVGTLKDSSLYKSGSINKSEIDSFGAIAFNCSRDLGAQDFNDLSEALQNLEDYINNNSNINPDEKLETYYTLIIMYNTYPRNLPDAHKKIGDIGKVSKDIIDLNAKSETLAFNNIIPLYELIASSYYSRGMSASNIEDKRMSLSNSLIWYGYLEDLNHSLPETLELRKGNAYKGIFDTYNTPDQRQNMTREVIDNLQKAASVYSDIVAKNSSSFLASVNLTEVYLNMEMIKANPSERDFTRVISEYRKAVALKDSTRNLSALDLAQFSSLKQSLQMAGIRE
jgi:eukaryotic-like serine/threonine-protein kinase